MKLFFKTALILFATIFMTACDDKELTKDMVDFDRAFIPVWYFAYTGDADMAEKAMIPLQRKLKQFKKEHTAIFFTGNDWNESLRMTTAWIDEAECAIKDGDLKRAAVQLDHARYELMDMRYLYDIKDYYLDAVWNLETSIAVAVETSEDLKLKLLMWEEYVDLSKSVDAAWQNLLRTNFDPKNYGMDEAEILLFARRKHDLNKAIRTYLKSVETANGDEFEKAAKNMEPAYLNFLASFGDFENMQTFFAATP